MNLIDQINREQTKKLGKDIPDFAPGDTLRIGYKVSEGTRSRVQNYEGIVISRKGGTGISASFSVRKVSFGEGVERTFALYSPNVDSIKVIRSGKVRRAKLYYLRDRKGKSARIAEKIKKKIGVDVSVKPEETNKIVEPVKAEVSSDNKKKETSSKEVKVEKSTNEKK